MKTRLKICGLRRREDIDACVEFGADAVGFVFYEPSPRNVSIAQAAELASHLKPWVTPVALFVNPDPSLVHEVISHIPNVLLQFHGDESQDFCSSFRRPYLKAIRMKEGTNLVSIGETFHDAQALLLDSWSAGYGGSGHAFDWDALLEAPLPSQPIILSGGLTADLVFEAIMKVKPYGLDVSSGVEHSRGVKCPLKIRDFCHAVLKANTANIQS